MSIGAWSRGYATFGMLPLDPCNQSLRFESGTGMALDELIWTTATDVYGLGPLTDDDDDKNKNKDKDKDRDNDKDKDRDKDKEQEQASRHTSSRPRAKEQQTDEHRTTSCSHEVEKCGARSGSKPSTCGNQPTKISRFARTGVLIWGFEGFGEVRREWEIGWVGWKNE
ncbi:hypothetical protein BDP27DRAFT_1357778 [Rhodocollybia butyracea]|uniref:Uncharacterized protein n=1 Tax=Rhodocollybia butyracea TaxID=206335 RepID=A0A9P5Q7P9_9AGAR|nr:hypothetical protein BDP27DRAFT_1357778 [Rhodocollybia butyracea]